MKNAYIEKIIEENKKLEEEYLNEAYENVNKLQEQIDKEGLVDISVFVDLLANYEILAGKVEIFELPDKYMQMAYDRAMEDVRFKRNIVNAYICLGKHSQLKKYNDKALLYYNKAIETEPNNADLYVIRGTYYEAIKKHKQALNDYKKALALNPDDVAMQLIIKHREDGCSNIKGILIIIGTVVLAVLSILVEIL